jgi:uncharacterized protein
VTPGDGRHLPRLAPIDSYGNGGFRFADLSHRGSLLCLPSGMWAWPVRDAAAIDPGSLGRVFAEAANIDILILGSGVTPWRLPEAVRGELRAAGIRGMELLQTGPAVRTYNILLAEGRRLAAGLIAVD